MSTTGKENKDNPIGEGGVEAVVPSVVTPPELKSLLNRLDVIDEKVEFVLGETSMRRGLAAGTWLGLLYGIVVGLFICVFLEYVVQLI